MKSIQTKITSYFNLVDRSQTKITDYFYPKLCREEQYAVDALVNLSTTDCVTLVSYYYDKNNIRRGPIPHNVAKGWRRLLFNNQVLTYNRDIHNPKGWKPITAFQIQLSNGDWKYMNVNRKWTTFMSQERLKPNYKLIDLGQSDP